MDYTLLLAKLFGLYLIVMGLAMFFRQKDLKEVLRELSSRAFVPWFAGIMLFIVGGLIVFTHNIWEGTLATLVTLFGWIIFIKGILYLLMPQKNLKKFIHAMHTKAWFAWGGLISLAVGIYMTGVSFGWF